MLLQAVKQTVRELSVVLYSEAVLLVPVPHFLFSHTLIEVKAHTLLYKMLQVHKTAFYPLMKTTPFFKDWLMPLLGFPAVLMSIKSSSRKR